MSLDTFLKERPNYFVISTPRKSLTIFNNTDNLHLYSPSADPLVSHPGMFSGECFLASLTFKLRRLMHRLNMLYQNTESVEPLPANVAVYYFLFVLVGTKHKKTWVYIIFSFNFEEKMRHLLQKCVFRDLIIVIGRQSPSNPSFGMTQTTDL